MKKTIAFLLACVTVLTALFSAGCQKQVPSDEENRPTRTVIELDERNYWKYLNFRCDARDVSPGEKGSVSYAITGVLDYALYEDVVISFDVIYYTDGQTEDEYGTYTMRIGCNAAGDAEFTTFWQGITTASVGKWLGIDGELVSFENYHWKIQFKSVTGKVIFTR